MALDDKTICTEWDKFHRLDIALVRAIGATPMAEELYQLAAAMDHMFHLGDGRLLLRAVAHRTGTTVKSGAMPGMTRQAVALTREPGNLVHKFRALTASSRGIAMNCMGACAVEGTPRCDRCTARRELASQCQGCGAT